MFARPTRSADAYFTVLAAVSEQRSARLGLAISKKQVARAVDRNRLKRLIRESFRQHLEELCGLDLVVMARRSALGIDNARLRGSLESHWRKLSAETERLRRVQITTSDTGRGAPASDTG